MPGTALVVETGWRQQALLPVPRTFLSSFSTAVHPVPITQHSLKGWQDPQYLSSPPQTSPGSRAASLSLLGRESRCQLTGGFSSLSEPGFRMLGATAAWHPMWRVAQSCSMACGSMVSCPGTKGVLVQQLFSIYLSTNLLTIHSPSTHLLLHPLFLPSFHPSSTYPLSTHPSMFPCIHNSSIHHPYIYSSILSSIHHPFIFPTHHSSMYPSCLSPIIHPPIHHPFIYLLFNPFIIHPYIHTWKYPTVHPLIQSSIQFSAHSSTHLTIHLSTHPPTHPST